MGRPKSTVPAYRLHKASGLAVATIDGRDIYLGPHGSRESRERYARLLAERAADQDALSPTNAITIRTLVAWYWRWIDREGRYTKNGRETTERGWIRAAFKPLLALYGRTPVAAFGPIRLETVRGEMMKPRHGRPPRRSTINGRVRRIRQLFRWGVRMELVPPSVLQAFATVPGLRRGESTRVREPRRIKPVPEHHLTATLDELGPVLAAMVRVQLLTGMRPDEVRRMRACDLDRSREVWRYYPDGHKTEHHGHERIACVGPRAQAIIEPFLTRDVDAFLFNPEKSEAIRKRMIRTEAEKRWSARSETHRVRPNRARDAARRENPKVQYRGVYDADAYRRAIQRACRRAGVPPWCPLQLRHNAGTRLRREFGIDAAQVVLGHEDAATTEVYAEPDVTAAEDAMRRIG